MASHASWKRPFRLSSSLVVALGVLAGSPEKAQAQTVQGCEPNEFVDRTGPNPNVRVLNWDFGIQDTEEACIQVLVGQTVVWSGDLDNHPLSGDTVNPITFHQNGSVTFTAPGTFGYECLSHSPMIGAVGVVAAPPAAAPATSSWLIVALTTLLLASGLFAIRFHRSRRAESA